MEYIITVERLELAADMLQAFPTPKVEKFVGVVCDQFDGYIFHETRPQYNRLNTIEDAKAQLQRGGFKRVSEKTWCTPD